VTPFEIDLVVAFFPLTAVAYFLAVFALYRETRGKTEFVDSRGIPIRVFSINPIDNLRFTIFVLGPKTGHRNVDLIRSSIKVIFVIFAFGAAGIEILATKY